MCFLYLLGRKYDKSRIDFKEYSEFISNYKTNDILKTVLSIYSQYINELKINNILPDYKLHDNILYLFTNLLESNQKIDYQVLLNKVYKIKIKVDELVLNYKKTNQFNEDNKILISDLNTINNELETTLMSKMHEKYNASRYEFIDYVVNNMKNEAFFKFSISRFPHYINSRNNNGEHIIIKIIDEYFNLITNESPSSEIIYYKSIINIFFNNPKFKINDNEQKIINDKINNLLNNNELDAKNVFRLREIQGQIFKDSVYNQKNISELNIIYDKKFGFSEEVIKSLPNIINSAYSKETKNNKEIIVTIDSEDTLDMDDAFSISNLNNGNFLLKIYITDVASKVLYNSPLDIEALKRGSTIYLSNNIISMLPTELSNNVLSLNSNSLKQVIAYIFEITPNGEIVDFKMEKDYIKPTKRLSYDFVNRISETQIEYNEIASSLYNFYYIAYVLKSGNKIKNDYRYVEELKKWLDGLAIQGNKYKNRTKAEIIVEEFMLLTGRSVSEFCLKNNIPIIYRNHEITKKDIFDNIEFLKKINEDDYNAHEYTKLIKNFISQYPSAFYGMDNKGHVGLGYESYSHVTSPLRRYCDLMNQRILTDCYIEPNIESFKKYSSEFINIVDKLNQSEHINYEYSKEYEKIMTLKR